MFLSAVSVFNLFELLLFLSGVSVFNFFEFTPRKTFVNDNVLELWKTTERKEYSTVIM